MGFSLSFLATCLFRNREFETLRTGDREQKHTVHCSVKGFEDPRAHHGKIYPLFGPVEFSYQKTAQVLSRVLGKSVEYKQVDFEEFKKILQARDKASAKGKGREGNDFLFQHLREVAIDHQNGVFEGTNDLVEKLGGRPPLTLEAFITKHRKAFELRIDAPRATP